MIYDPQYKEIYKFPAIFFSQFKSLGVSTGLFLLLFSPVRCKPEPLFDLLYICWSTFLTLEIWPVFRPPGVGPCITDHGAFRNRPLPLPEITSLPLTPGEDPGPPMSASDGFLKDGSWFSDIGCPTTLDGRVWSSHFFTPPPLIRAPGADDLIMDPRNCYLMS